MRTIDSPRSSRTRTITLGATAAAVATAIVLGAVGTANAESAAKAEPATVTAGNPIKAAAEDAMLPLVIFACFLGFAMTRLKPEPRAQLTGVLTNLILPGTVLAADIDKAIETGKGKASLATMGGGTVTATKEGGKIVLTDAAGHKATVTQADEQFSNGVVHQIDGVLMPSKQASPDAPAVGKKAG